MNIIKALQKGKNIWEILHNIDASDIEEALRLSSDAYYNTDKPLISDEEYDILVDKLKKIKPKSSFFKTVGAPLKGKKVKLKYWMGSMQKFKTEKDINSFTKLYDGPYLFSDKLDGISCLLIYSDSEFKLFTRGNGSEGQDITHLFNMVNIFPNKKKSMKKIEDEIEEELTIRGELIIAKDTFEDKYSGIMKNARNMVSGIVVSKPTSVNKKHATDVDFVAYEVIEPRKKPSKQLEYLSKLGFNVVPHKIIEEIDLESVDDFLKKRKKKSLYEIDGLICTDDIKHPRNTSGNPPYSFAYKGTSMSKETKVKSVVWKSHKDGHIIPTIIYEPVQLPGAELNRTTGFNAKFIKDKGIGPGAIIEVVRSGDTIPYVMDVIKSVKPSFPAVDYHWDDNETNIILDNPNDDSGVTIMRLTKFVKDIGVENMSEGIVTKIVNAGYDSIPSLLKLKVDDLLEIDGFKETLAEKIVNNIKTAIDNIDLLVLMAASNCFGRGFGKRKLKKVLDVYPSIVDDYDSDDEDRWHNKIMKIPGFDTISVDAFLEAMPDFQKFYKVIKRITKIKDYEPIKVNMGKFAGMSVVFTGFRAGNWKEIIEAEGGELSSGVSGKTTFLVYTAGKEGSGSYVKAEKLGVRKLTETQFMNEFNLPPKSK